MQTDMLHPLLANNQSQLQMLCKEHYIKRLYAFGSVCRDDFTQESDIDLLYTFDYERLPIYDAADIFFDFTQKVESIIGRTVDLVSEPAIRNPLLRSSIDADKVLLYEA